MKEVESYTFAITFMEKAKCSVAKLFGAKVVTPSGRVMLLPEEYVEKAIEENSEDVEQIIKRLSKV